MIWKMVNTTASLNDGLEQDFSAGNYVLQLHRSIQETRKRLGLSNREIELLLLIGSGHRKHEIAQQMGVTTSTADTFRRRAYAKLGVGTGAAATAILMTYMAGAEIAEVAS
jgi:DNA-binding CsgD family transcriptional regulator